MTMMVIIITVIVVVWHHRYITNTAPAFDDVIERRCAAVLCDLCRRGAFQLAYRYREDHLPGAVK